MTKFYKPGYPRPQLVRESFLPLNGCWDFCFDHENAGEALGWEKGFAPQTQITVPFSYEAQSSGIGQTQHCPAVWYQRQCALPHNKDERVLLHFEGCDYETRVWVNGLFIGRHTGGYCRFGFDITEALCGENARIVVCARDSMDATQPRGKQRWLAESYDCWYVQTTGIWRDVWCEVVHRAHICEAKITPLYDEGSVRFELDVERGGFAGELLLETTVTFGGVLIHRGSRLVTRRDCCETVPLSADFAKWKLKFWSPQSPNLYDVQFRLLCGGNALDCAGSYFGLRKFSAENGRLTLNNMHIYLRMVLDQGYWEESLLTPPDEEALVKDLRKMQQYGYNGVRKHQKTEDERFYYWADVLGLLVWCEAPSAYDYNDRAVFRFTTEWTELVHQYYNHPSIVTWVPFNESWGLLHVFCDRSTQHFTEGIYHLTKALDPHRPVIVNDGWEHTVSDIITLHDYSQTGADLLRHWKDREGVLQNRISFQEGRYAFAEGYAYHGQPVMLSEFGGVAYKNGHGGWGYGQSEDEEQPYLERLEGLFSAVEELDFLCGFCYTQLTDVQQEQNGHMYMDRTDKASPDVVRKMITRGKQP